MIAKYVLPILAVAGLVFAINRVVEARQPEPTAQPIVEPPARPDVGQDDRGARAWSKPAGRTSRSASISRAWSPRFSSRRARRSRRAIRSSGPTTASSSRCSRCARPSSRRLEAQLHKLIVVATARRHPAGQGGRPGGRGQDGRRRGGAGADRAAVSEADDRRQRLRQGSLCLSTPPRRPMPRPRPTSRKSWREAGRKTSKSPGPPSSSPRARSRASRSTSSD